MKPKTWIIVAGLLAVLMGAYSVWYAQDAQAQNANNQSTSQLALKATPPKAIPIFSTVNLGARVSITPAATTSSPRPRTRRARRSCAAPCTWK